MIGVSTYGFTHAQAVALIALAARAGRISVAVPALGAISVFKPTGGQRAWNKIDCKF